MSHTNSTTNYALPQFLPTDKPFWLTDINGAFSTIDTAIDAAKDAADNAQNDATQALSDASAAGTAATGADTKAAGALASIANAYDSTATYALGDLVIYNSLLYVNTTAIITPEAWDGSHWTRITIEDELDSIANDISTITSTLSNKQDKIPDTVAKTVVNDVTPSGGEIRAKFYNRVLYVSGYIQYSSNQAASTQLLHINDVTLAMEVYESVVTSNNASVRTKLTTDGKLVLESALPANSWISVTFAALIA